MVEQTVGICTCDNAVICCPQMIALCQPPHRGYASRTGGTSADIHGLAGGGAGAPGNTGSSMSACEHGSEDFDPLSSSMREKAFEALEPESGARSAREESEDLDPAVV